MIGSMLDRAIGVLSPEWGAKRIRARATMQQIETFSNSAGGYNAGKYNRLTRNWTRLPKTENEIPRAQLDQLIAESWNLYRNNPYGRKIVRTLETKVIGRGLHPQPLTKMADGSPHVEFRKRARQLWWEMASKIDIRGLPGRGGIDFVEMQKLALRSVILSGETLTRPVALKSAKQRDRKSPIPLALQMIDARRLSLTDKAEGFVSGNDFYRGIELSPDGERVAYHVLVQRLDELTTDRSEVRRIKAEDAIHVFASEDIDQLRGVPWLSAAILQARDTGDYQYNTLKSSAIAACFAIGYKLGRGKTRLGLAEQTTGGLQDSEGNAITSLQPGLLIDLSGDGEINGINPPQPTTNAESFIQHLLRGVGQAAPGIKSSTITGDYRNSSFSSERSADNDCWPEMESVQDWFATAWCQPIYERIIRDGIVSGYFSGVVSAEEFADRERDYLDTAWQGPVPRSINPTDDAKSARMRIGNGQSSPQIECAAIGRDPEDVIRDLAEWIQQCQDAGLPDWVIAKTLGDDKATDAVQQQQEGAANNAEQASVAA